MRIITWNIISFRTITQRGILQKYLKKWKPDIVILNETKVPYDFLMGEKWEGYYYWIAPSIKSGYAGVMLLSKIQPINITCGLSKFFCNEGRLITADYGEFYLLAVYFPNAGEALKRLEFKLKWCKQMLAYIKKLMKVKPIIMGGDINIAHEEIDIFNPKTHNNSSGFTKEERKAFSNFLDIGLVDIFRYLHPKKVAYSYWSMRTRARNRNAGWRLDYFLISNDLINLVKRCVIQDGILGSDHCPILLDLLY